MAALLSRSVVCVGLCGCPPVNVEDHSKSQCHEIAESLAVINYVKEMTAPTKWKMPRRLSKRGNHLEQESNRQKTMESINVGLHPAVYGQSLGER